MILVIAGTNRKNSRSSIIAHSYATILRQQSNEDIRVLDLKILPNDFIFSALYENALTHPEFNEIQNLVDQADKIVFIISEYNGSFPGALKAFIDGLRYPDTFTGKKGAMVGFSSSPYGSAMALSHMGDILNFLGMYLVPSRPKLAYIEEAMDEQALTESTYFELLEAQAEELLLF